MLELELDDDVDDDDEIKLIASLLAARPGELDSDIAFDHAEDGEDDGRLDTE